MAAPLILPDQKPEPTPWWKSKTGLYVLGGVTAVAIAASVGWHAGQPSDPTLPYLAALVEEQRKQTAALEKMAQPPPTVPLPPEQPDPHTPLLERMAAAMEMSAKSLKDMSVPQQLPAPVQPTPTVEDPKTPVRPPFGAPRPKSKE